MSPLTALGQFTITIQTRFGGLEVKLRFGQRRITLAIRGLSGARQWPDIDTTVPRERALFFIQPIIIPMGESESYTWKTYEQNTIPIVPETVGEATLEAVCAATASQ